MISYVSLDELAYESSQLFNLVTPLRSLVTLFISQSHLNICCWTEDNFFCQLGVSRTFARRLVAEGEADADVPSLFGQEIKKSFANGPARWQVHPSKTDSSCSSVAVWDQPCSHPDDVGPLNSGQIVALNFAIGEGAATERASERAM